MYRLTGQPQALKRPRFGNQRVYDSQKKEKYAAQQELVLQKPSIIRGLPLHLCVTFYMKKPQRFNPQRSYYHTSRPDLDNLIKYLQDVCTGILYDDDCTIASITATKQYDPEPRSEFTLKTIS